MFWLKQRERLCPSTFLFYSGLERIWIIPTLLGKDVLYSVC